MHAESMNNSCCDVCSKMSSLQLTDHSSEFRVAYDAIQQIGDKGEAKLNQWIRDNSRPWMNNLNKSCTSYANPCGHSQEWWHTFFRKCHAHGILERKVCNLAKSNQHYAVMAVYAMAWKEQKVISDDEPVMLLDMEEDVVRHRKVTGTYAIKDGSYKKRSAKGGPLIDRLHELMNNMENWKLLESKEGFLYPGKFSTVTQQYMLFPDIEQIKPNVAVKEDFIWQDIQLSKGKTNLPRDIKVTINGKQETLKYRMASCAGIKKCPESNCGYIVPIKDIIYVTNMTET